MGSDRQTVIVTGGANGLGRAIATAFVDHGADVAIVDINLDAAKACAEALSTNARGSVIGVSADVADRNSSTAAHHEITDTLGPATVLVNNAGIMPQRKGWIEELPPEDFDRMMAIHVNGAINWSRLVLPAMRAASFGRLVNIASVNALLAVPHRLGYVTAKKAILGLTEALALDCARAGITVNAVIPGYIATETLKARAEAGVLDFDGIAHRTPVGRWGTPEEIADAVFYLARNASGYITGTTLVVDGGFSIRGDSGENLDVSPFEGA